MDDFDYIDRIFRALNYDLFVLGDAKITPLTIFYLLILSILLIYLSGKLKNILVKKLLGKTRLDLGAQLAIGTITRYAILFFGFLVVLQTVGINLTTLNVVAGAIGIGVGFGLQNIANNFISGLIILTERPIKVGDRIEVGSVNGEVVTIGARSTRVRTNDNIAIIVPNSKFISENVVNWSYENKTIRFRIPVAVAYNADMDQVSKLLIEAANENADVASEPAPSVRCMKFDDSALYLELRAWSRVRLHQASLFKSNLYFAIIKKFRENNIELPDQQPDIYVQNDSGEYKLSTKKTFNDSDTDTGNESVSNTPFS